jgi:hypothetical protein
LAEPTTINEQRGFLHKKEMPTDPCGPVGNVFCQPTGVADLKLSAPAPKRDWPVLCKPASPLRSPIWLIHAYLRPIIQVPSQ